MDYNFLIGGISGIVSRTMVAPIELYRIQKQNPFVPHSNMISVYKKEGLRFFWKGNMTNCVRVFPQMAINYSVFRKTKMLLEDNIKNKNMLNLVSGCNAGLISILLIYPLETTRTYLSLQTNKNKYRGITDVLRRLSIRELYQGSKMSLLGFGSWSGLQYSSYYYINNIVKDTFLDTKFISGGLSGMFAVTITYPSDLIRRRLQLQGFDNSVPKYNGIIDCVKKIYKYEGIKGFYRGLLANYVKTGPTLAIQFWTIEYLNKILNNKDI